MDRYGVTDAVGSLGDEISCRRAKWASIGFGEVEVSLPQRRMQHTNKNQVQRAYSGLGRSPKCFTGGSLNVSVLTLGTRQLESCTQRAFRIVFRAMGQPAGSLAHEEKFVYEPASLKLRPWAALASSFLG